VSAEKERPKQTHVETSWASPNKKMAVFPGLFDYSGFGYGTLFLDAEGTNEWLTTSQAVARASELGLKFKYHDSLEGYTGTYLGD
jgi:hypothetical protein